MVRPRGVLADEPLEGAAALRVLDAVCHLRGGDVEAKGAEAPRGAPGVERLGHDPDPGPPRQERGREACVLVGVARGALDDDRGGGDAGGAEGLGHRIGFGARGAVEQAAGGNHDGRGARMEESRGGGHPLGEDVGERTRGQERGAKDDDGIPRRDRVRGHSERALEESGEVMGQAHGRRYDYAMRAQVWFVITALAGCGDDGGQRRENPDAAEPADAAIDAAEPIDAPVDAPMGMLVSDNMFDTTLGMLCGLGFDESTGDVHVVPCQNTQVHVYSVEGTLRRTEAWSGELADDADIEISDATYTLGTTSVAPGDSVRINGETGPAELYAEGDDGAVTLTAAFGDSHVVGGSYHPGRGSFFVLQDRAAATAANTVAELDLVTGALIQSFPTGAFDVSFGDLDVCNATGELLVTSSVQPSIIRYSPTGAVLGTLTLPAALTPSGIALDGAGGAWLSTTSGLVVHVTGVPCG